MADDPAAQLLKALEALDDVGSRLTPDEAAAELDTASLQLFWRDWPHVSGWAGQLWRLLNSELEEASQPHDVDDDLDEIGGSG
ncbi:MAG TPA: hypothetical protein VGA36_09795 [Nitriliruptorales bacterium]